MSVRKRTWTTSKGEVKEAWVADYADGQGDRHIATFERKKDAEAFIASAKVDVGKGVHTAPSKSVTVAEACALWLKTGEGNGLERTSIDSYRQHADLHIIPFLGTIKLSALTTAGIRNFEDALRAKGRSPVMAKRILTSLGSMLADAQERGLVAQNVVRHCGRVAVARTAASAARMASSRSASIFRPQKKSAPSSSISRAGGDL